MKSKRLFGIILVSLFLFNFVSASLTYTVQHDYYKDDTYVKSVYYTFDKDYQENENRYSVSDYKEGYTYRVSKAYLEKKYDKDYSQDYSRTSFYGKNRKFNDKITYYQYVPYMGTYEEKNCYDSPPKGKLFYIKCDF